MTEPLTAPDASQSAGSPSGARFVRAALRGPVSWGSLQTLTIAVLGSACSLVAQTVLARALGVDAYGAFLFALAAMNVALLVGKLEIDTCSIRFVGAYAASARWGLLRGFIGTARRTVMVFGTIATVVGALAVAMARPWLAARHPSLPSALWMACLLLLPSALLLLNGAMLQGLGRYVLAQVPWQLIRPATMITVVVVWLYAGVAPMTATAAITISLLATVLALAGGDRFLSRSLPVELAFHEPEYELQDWRRTMIAMLVVSISQFVISHASDVLIVGVLLGTRAAALYGASAQLATVVDFAQASVLFVAAPMIASTYGSRSAAELQRLIGAVNRINLLICLPVALGILAFGRVLLSFYGPGFVSAYGVLVVLVVTQLVGGLLGAIAGYLLTMTTHQRAAAWIIGGNAVLTLTLTLLLTPRYGIMGTAWATFIGTTTRCLALEYHIRSRMRLRLLAF